MSGEDEGQGEGQGKGEGEGWWAARPCGGPRGSVSPGGGLGECAGV